MQFINLIQLIQMNSIRRSIQVAMMLTALTYAKDAVMGQEAFNVEVTGQGQPLILIPGLGCSGDVWDETVDALKSEYECHSLTLSGFAGRKKAEYEGKFVDFVASQLKAYIVEQKLSEPVVIGHSLGGFIGLSIASEQEHLLKGLIVVDSLPFLPAMMNPGATEESMETMAKGMVQQSLNMDSSYYKQMLASMITNPEDIEEVFAWSNASDAETVGAAMYELYSTDLRDDIANIEFPVLVLGSWVAYKAYGSTRESTEAIYNTQYAALPKYELKMTDIGRHFIMLDDLEFLLEESRNYLEIL